MNRAKKAAEELAAAKETAQLTTQKSQSGDASARDKREAEKANEEVQKKQDALQKAESEKKEAQLNLATVTDKAKVAANHAKEKALEAKNIAMKKGKEAYEAAQKKAKEMAKVAQEKGAALSNNNLKLMIQIRPPRYTEEKGAQLSYSWEMKASSTYYNVF